MHDDLIRELRELTPPGGYAWVDTLWPEITAARERGVSIRTIAATLLERAPRKVSLRALQAHLGRRFRRTGRRAVLGTPATPKSTTPPAAQASDTSRKTPSAPTLAERTRAGRYDPEEHL